MPLSSQKFGRCEEGGTGEAHFCRTTCKFHEIRIFNLFFPPLTKENIISHLGREPYYKKNSNCFWEKSNEFHGLDSSLKSQI